MCLECCLTMKPTLAILTLFLSLQIFVGCSASKNTNVSNESLPVPSQSVDPAKAANDNADELEMLINLPYQPVEVAYREDSANNSRNLTAVLRFSSAEADNIVKKAAAIKPPTETQIKIQDWFPVELVDRGDVQQATTLTGQTYPADEFFKAPFLNGTLSRIGETDYFVLVMTAEIQPSS